VATWELLTGSILLPKTISSIIFVEVAQVQYMDVFSTTAELCLGVLSHPSVSVTMHVHGHICMIPACPRLVADPVHAPDSCAYS